MGRFMTAQDATNRAVSLGRGQRGRGWLVALLLGLAPVAVYWNSLPTPFVLDDRPVVTENPSIRSLWPLSGPLSPPAGGLPVCSRPVANLSFALNYAVGGEAVAGYHALNVVLHVLAGLTLFGVLRRTLARPAVPERFRTVADALALAVATLWALHPLQTAAVTYVSQRTELLATLCYLLTLLAFIRAAESPAPAKRWWTAAAVTACLAGMGSKETMASAPLIVLLYDRTFLAGSLAEAWRRRWPLHGALMATWVLLGWLVLGSESRGGTAGWDVAVTPLAYAATQGEAITGYLGRSVWPHPLVFDYGDYLAPPAWPTFVRGAGVVALVAGTLVALWRRPVAGFAGALFFGLLAPSSSVVPVATQTIADHRMYLPLAVVLTALALGVYAWLGRRAWVVGLVAAGLAGALTVARNQDFASPVTLWRDTVAKRPENMRARNNLSAALLEANQTEAGLAELHAALRLKPDHPDLLRNLAQAELFADQVPAALAHAEQAQQLDPRPAGGWALLGAVRLRAGQVVPAVEAYRRAIQLQPDLAAAHLGLGDAQAAQQDFAAALAAYGQARRLRPDSAEAAYGQAVALFQAGRNDEAIAVFAELGRRRPGYPGLHLNYGGALLDAGRAEQALGEFDAALAQEPPTAELLHLRALALLELGRTREATEVVRQTLQLAPGYTPALELARQLGLALQ